MSDEGGFKRIGEFSNSGDTKRPSRYKTRKDELWYFAFNKCKKEWGGKKPLTKKYFAIKTALLKEEKDWDYIISKCTQEEARGEVWSKIFWGSLK